MCLVPIVWDKGWTVNVGKQRVACRLFACASGMRSINFLSVSCASLRNVFHSWEGISYEKISTGLRASFATYILRFPNSYFLIKMDGGGFEPPKQFAADLQSVPFGHSGIRPYEMYNLNNISLYHTAGQIASSFLEIG